jgi:hypothetical protein
MANVALPELSMSPEYVRFRLTCAALEGLCANSVFTASMSATAIAAHAVHQADEAIKALLAKPLAWRQRKDSSRTYILGSPRG